MRFRLLADDRTGAIDAAARFVPLAGPFLVHWDLANGMNSTESFGLDLGIREMPDPVAAKAAATAADVLRDCNIAYFKCDSQLRGPTAIGIAACLRGRNFAHCIIAPAFPAQRRITRGGMQWAASQGAEDWRMVGPDLGTQLAELGFPVSLRRPGEAVPEGVSLWDADTLHDLHRIVAEGRRLAGPVLWCGSAGLAEAIAGRQPPSIQSIRGPILALIGTDNPVTCRQLSQVDAWRAEVDLDRGADPVVLEMLLKMRNAAVVTARLPGRADRATAAVRIAETFAAVLSILPRPGTLFVTGGETLSGICAALEARALEVQGELEPGIPVSVLKGGRWDGLTIVSKSGAFGTDDLFLRLISMAQS